jgi:4-amino-4-deoxy-L-arabinose transferase-like glycosyltransferase
MAAMRFDRHLWLALLLAAAVLLPRAILIANAHSETYDDEYHLFRGARFWAASGRRTSKARRRAIRRSGRG